METALKLLPGLGVDENKKIGGGSSSGLNEVIPSSDIEEEYAIVFEKFEPRLRIVIGSTSMFTSWKKEFTADSHTFFSLFAASFRKIDNQP